VLTRIPLSQRCLRQRTFRRSPVLSAAHPPTRLAPFCAPVLGRFRARFGTPENSPRPGVRPARVQHDSHSWGMFCQFRRTACTENTPVRLKWTGQSCQPAGSTPVSATKESTTYGLCAVTRCDAQRASRAPQEMPKAYQTLLSASGSPELARVRARGRHQRRRRHVVGWHQEAADGARVASWPSVWRSGIHRLGGGTRDRNAGDKLTERALDGCARTTTFGVLVYRFNQTYSHKNVCDTLGPWRASPSVRGWL